YLLLTVAGAAIPLSAIVPWVAEHGLNLRLLVDELFANRISTFFALDVMVSAIAVAAFVLVERARSGIRQWFLPLIALCAIGVSCALPLFLYLRESSIAAASPAFRKSS